MNRLEKSFHYNLIKFIIILFCNFFWCFNNFKAIYKRSDNKFCSGMTSENTSSKNLNVLILLRPHLFKKYPPGEINLIWYKRITSNVILMIKYEKKRYQVVIHNLISFFSYFIISITILQVCMKFSSSLIFTWTGRSTVLLF